MERLAHLRFPPESAPPISRRVGNADHDRPYEGAFVGGTHHFALRVYFEDTDAAGIVYYANYLRFLERARSDMLRALGIDQRASFEQGEGVYAVAELSIKYRAPARLDDALLILSELGEIRAAAVVIHQRVMRGHQILADASVTAALLTRDGRPRRQPRLWVEAYQRMKAKGD